MDNAAKSWCWPLTLFQLWSWRKSRAIPLSPLCTFIACYRVNFTFKLKSKLIWNNCYCFCCLSVQQNMWQHMQIRPLCYGYSHPHKSGPCYLYRKHIRTYGQCAHIISKVQCITNKRDFRLLPWYSWGLPSLGMFIIIIIIKSCHPLGDIWHQQNIVIWSYYRPSS